MNHYRMILKRRILLLAIVVNFAVAFCIFDQFIASLELRNHDVFGFQLGIILAVGMIALIKLNQYRKILGDLIYVARFLFASMIYFGYTKFVS